MIHVLKGNVVQDDLPDLKVTGVDVICVRGATCESKGTKQFREVEANIVAGLVETLPQNSTQEKRAKEHKIESTKVSLCKSDIFHVEYTKAKGGLHGHDRCKKKINPEDDILSALSPEDMIDAAFKVAGEALKKMNVTIKNII